MKFQEPLQFDKPLFVRIPFDARGHKWEAGEHFPWREMSIPEDKVYILYRERYLIHDDTKSVELKIGDGLEALDVPSLHNLVDDYNKRIKAVVSNNTQFDHRKMKKSTLQSKQIGLIRSWRRNNEDWLNKAEQVKKG